MSNELLNAYIKFGEPNGDDLDFSQIADWAGYLLQEQRERIAELEAENQRLRERNEQLEHWFHGYRTPEESMAALVAENQRLREALVSIAEGDIYPRSIAKQALEIEI